MDSPTTTHTSPPRSEWLSQRPRSAHPRIDVRRPPLIDRHPPGSVLQFLRKSPLSLASFDSSGDKLSAAAGYTRSPPQWARHQRRGQLFAAGAEGNFRLPHLSTGPPKKIVLPSGEIGGHRRRSAKGPCVDGSGLARRIFTLRRWSERPCVRPVCAVHVTAGHNALRGAGPDQKHAFGDAVARVGCPDRRIDRRCIKCCSPFQPLRHTGMPGVISFTPRERRVPCSVRSSPSSPRLSWRACWQALWQRP